MTDLFKPTFIRAGVPHNRARPPTQIRPPTQATPGAVADESRTYAYNSGAGNPDHDWLIPTNVVAGDIIRIGICLFDLASGPPDIATKPSGYTTVVDLEETGNGVQDAHYYVFEKVADGTETDGVFTTDEDCRVVALSSRIASNGGTLGSAVVGTVSTDATGNIDPNPVAPGTDGSYAVQVWVMHNNGSADPDNASAPPTNYSFVDYVTSEAVARRPRIYLCQRAVDITTSEDPGEVGWDGTVEFALCRTFTVATRLAAGSAAVAAGDHTHTESDISDLDHWTEADHDALDHTGLTGVGVTDHGGLSGLTDDDHTNYLLAAGTRAATYLEVSGLTGATGSSPRFVGGTTTGAPASGTFQLGDYVVTEDGNIYVCTTAGSPGTWSAVGAGAATDSDAIHVDEANEISGITEKTTPADDDIIVIEDSAASFVKKKVKISNLPSGGGGGGGASSPRGTLDRSYTFDSTVESWTLDDGTLSSTGSKLRLAGNANNNTALEPGTATDLADGEVEFEGTYVSGGGDRGFVFRATDANNHYMLTLRNVATGLGNGGLELYKKVSGTYTSISAITVAPWLVTHRIRWMIRFEGEWVTVYRWDTCIGELPTDGTFTSGIIGFRDGAPTGSTADYDNVNVYSLD